MRLENFLMAGYAELSKSKLYDLIEYRWSKATNAFVKYQTRAYNIPKPMAYGLKSGIVSREKLTRSTRFKVVENGTKQYSNSFK